MVSVTQCASKLNVTPARVRTLIKSGALPATKSGGIWLIREEDVIERISRHPKAGRPPHNAPDDHADAPMLEEGPLKCRDAHAAYEACRSLFRAQPTFDLLQSASTQEEASFYVAVSDFFLQQRQAELVSRGVF